MSKEKFIKNNDYTLSVIISHKKTKVMKTFNFHSKQVTTNAPVGAANHETVQKFRDLASRKEVKAMHKQLKKMNAKPYKLAKHQPGCSSGDGGSFWG